MKSAKPATLDAVVKRIENVATLPQVAIQILRIAQDPDADAADMRAVIEGDPALCTSVLRFANSSAYALKLRVNNVQQAIAYLGMKQIRNLALTASVSTLFQSAKVIGNYSRPGLWRHLVSVGLGARMLGLRLKFRAAEDLFLAGLLHDIGIVLEDQHVNGPFTKTIQTLDPQKTLCENEQQSLGFDHCQLGALVADKWGLPETVKAAITHHHHAADKSCTRGDMVQFIEVANLLCTFKDISSVGVNLVRACPESIKGLDLTKEDLLAVSEALDRELAENAVMLGVAKAPEKASGKARSKAHA